MLKSRFESLEKAKRSDIESLDITPLRLKHDPPIKFSRSATCIDFSKLKLNETQKDPVKKEEPAKFQFQRQLSNSSTASYKSIRRSPAFRAAAQARPSVAKIVAKEDPVKKKTEVDEIEYLTTSLTIKKALSKPLPIGAPPKKPPRTFLSPQFPKKNVQESTFESRFQKLKISPNTLPKKNTKVEDKKPISSFLNCIISPCSIDPIYYEQIRSEQKRTRDVEEESIYMEPYAHLKKDFISNNNDKSPEGNGELHYMCTILDPQPSDMNGNVSMEDARRNSSSLEASDIEDYEKVSECIINYGH